MMARPARLMRRSPTVKTLAWLLVAMAIALAAGGCGLPQTPYNGRLACETVGGYYTADGRCLAGNS